MHKYPENAQKITAKSARPPKAPNRNKTPARKVSQEICQQSEQSQQNHLTLSLGHKDISATSATSVTFDISATFDISVT